MNTDEPSQNQQACELFVAALDHPAGPARDAWLAQACGTNAPLLARVRELLANHLDDDFLAQPAVAPPSDAIAESDATGQRLGSYLLVRKLDTGGMGDVYEAKQTELLRRRVALKIIKPGMDTRSVIARFEAERQALAKMDHPNIAKVLDAGTTESGRPYFVMELVRGIQITDYCRQNKLSTRERLDLFIKACQAVQHAHQKGIIHRDLKPSNILVTLQDGVPVPKVIDFGIAKAMSEDGPPVPTVTQHGQFLGTLTYASPEQASFGAQDIDTRSDIYSLGVLLYELLTGTTPIDADKLKTTGLDEMRRLIREVEPPKPSTRLTVELVAADVRRLKSNSELERARRLLPVKELRGDLDWITMKALEKDRARRYETATALAQDIQRHLDSEPVVAGAPTNLYRLQKLVRRNKGTFAAAAAVLLALLTGLGLTAWQAVRATRAERAERTERDRAVLAESDAKAKEHNAQQLLYDSLIGEARATRIAHRVGYREKAFGLIERARSVKPDDKDPELLRHEASLCLGDFVGQMPMVSITFPSNSLCSRAVLNNAGDTVAVGMEDGDVRLYSAQSGEAIAVLEGGGTVRSMSFNVSGDQLLTIHVPAGDATDCRCDEAVAYLWRRSMQGIWMPQTNAPLPYIYQCFAYRTGFGVVRRDRKDSHLSLIEYGTTNQIRTVNWPSSKNPPELMLTLDGSLIAAPADTEAGTVEIAINVSGISSGGLSEKTQTPLIQPHSISFSPDGRYVGCLDFTGGYIYNRNDPLSTVRFPGYFEPRTKLAFAPHRTLVAIPFVQQGRIRLWDWIKNVDIAIIDGVFQPKEVAFAGNGKFLMTRSSNHIRVYSLNSAPEHLPLRGHSKAVPAVAFSPDGTQLASVGKDRFLKVWNASTGEVIWETNGLPQPAQCVLYASSGNFLITAERADTGAWIWNTQNRRHELTASAEGWSLNSAQCSPDGHFLAMMRKSRASLETVPGVIMLWRSDFSGRLSPSVEFIGSVRVPHSPESLIFSPSGRRIAFGASNPSQLLVWDFLKTTNFTVISTNLFNSSQGASFTPDSSRIVSINRRREVEIHDATGAGKVFFFPTAQFDQGDASVTRANLCLSPDGKTLALVSKSKRGVNLWELATGRLLYSLREQEGSIWWLAWSPDSTRLAVARDNGDISIWKLDEVEQILTKINLPPASPSRPNPTTETSQSNTSKSARP